MYIYMVYNCEGASSWWWSIRAQSYFHFVYVHVCKKDVLNILHTDLMFDHFYRCVVMVGLPYPNITSPELKEKMAYMNSTMVQTLEVGVAGRDLEKLCLYLL